MLADRAHGGVMFLFDRFWVAFLTALVTTVLASVLLTAASPALAQSQTDSELVSLVQSWCSARCDIRNFSFEEERITYQADDCLGGFQLPPVQALQTSTRGVGFMISGREMEEFEVPLGIVLERVCEAQFWLGV